MDTSAAGYGGAVSWISESSDATSADIWTFGFAGVATLRSPDFLVVMLLYGVIVRRREFGVVRALHQRDVDSQHVGCVGCDPVGVD